MSFRLYWSYCSLIRRKVEQLLLVILQRKEIKACWYSCGTWRYHANVLLLAIDTHYTGRLVCKKLFICMSEYAEYGFDQQRLIWYVCRRWIWCLADVSSVSPSSEHTTLFSQCWFLGNKHGTYPAKPLIWLWVLTNTTWLYYTKWGKENFQCFSWWSVF